MAHPSVSVGVQLFLVDGVWWWCVVLALPHSSTLPNPLIPVRCQTLSFQYVAKPSHSSTLPNPNCQLIVGYVMVHVVFR